MTGNDTWTILRLLEWTTDYLRDRGADTPRLDAEVLLAHVMQCERIDLYTSYDEIAGDSVRTGFRELVKRRAEGQPVAYLVGQREFYSRAFEVTPDVLIPRPETEFVLLELLERVAVRPRNGSGEGGPDDNRDSNQPPRIVDVGTGSGILAICAALELPRAQVTAVDISPAALAVARRNAERHHVTDRVEFVESDLFNALPTDLPLDHVVSNPPYVSAVEFAELDSSVRDWEPKAALLAGDLGTEIVERLVQQAGNRLRPGGCLIFEISPMIAEASLDIVRADGRFGSLQTRRDLAQLARVISATRI